MHASATPRVFLSVRLFAHNTSTAERIYVIFGTVVFLDTLQFCLKWATATEILHEDPHEFLRVTCSVFIAVKNTFNQNTGEN